MIQATNPYNEMVVLVISSANDVLNGSQTWDEHIEYLLDVGKHLPFDLIERSCDARNYSEN